MKRILFILLSMITASIYAQSPTTIYWLRSKVTDSTTVSTTGGYGVMYFNAQATTPHWDIWNGSSMDHVFDFNSGGATYTAGSGMTLSSNAFKLGGAITENTTLSGSGFNLTYGSSGTRLGNYRVWSNGTIGLDGSTSSFLQTGSNTLSTTTSGISMATTGPILLNTAAGTSGQVLTSAGSGASPAWSNLPTITTRNRLPSITKTTSFTLAKSDTSKLIVLDGSALMTITLADFSGGPNMQFAFVRDSTQIDTVYFNAGGQAVQFSGGKGIPPEGFAYISYSQSLNKFFIATGSTSSGGGGSGTVTSVSVTTANGVSGSVATATTTPAISLTLGAITPTSVNGVIVSGSSTPTLAVTGTTTVSGTNTGDQTTVTGNAGTATALQTARTIGTVTGDATSAGSSFNGTSNNTNALTVTKINGTSLAGLSTGILKNTTATGVPSIAVAADFPTLNQNTTGNAATVTTNANLTGDVTSVGNVTTLATVPISKGGTNNTSFSTDGINFFDGTKITNNATNLTWSNTGNMRLFASNLGNTTITAPQTGTLMHLVSNSATFNGRISLDSYVASQTTGSIFQGRTAQGTNSVPTAAQTDQSLAVFGGDGYGTTGFHGSSVGAMTIRAGSNHTDTNGETYLAFTTTPNASTTSAERLRISSAGLVGIGVTPAVRLHVQGVGTTTGELLRLTSSTPTTRLTILDNGQTSWVGSVSGAAAIARSDDATVTATANTQTQTGWDYNLNTVDGGFTGLTRNVAQWRVNGSATPVFSILPTQISSRLVSLWDLNFAGDMTMRNTGGAFFIKGGSGSGAGAAIKAGVSFASSTDNNIFFDFTGTTHAIVTGPGLTRTFNGVNISKVVTSVDGNTITDNAFTVAPTYSVGTSTLNQNSFRVLTGESGFGVTDPTATLHVVGTTKLDGSVTLPTAGNGVLIKEGTNATMGVATLVAGTITVSTTKVTANSRIFLTGQNLGTITVPVGYAVSARTAGTSFTILSANVVDTSTVAWVIVEPAP